MATGSPKFFVLLGPVFALVGLALGWPNVQARFDFADAPQVRATVVDADYHRTVRGTEARAITLAAPGLVSLDDLRTVPDDLEPGDVVTALVRSDGHALLPTQLDLEKLFLPAVLAVIGLAATAIGVVAILADRPKLPTGPTDPEAWI